MDFIKKWLLENGGKIMLTKLWDALEGYKTYVLAVIGILVAVAGHFWGPFSLGSVQVPTFTWNEVFNVIWTSGLFSFLHMKK